MSSLGFDLFGRLSVRRGAQQLDGFGAAKIQELLGYLLLHRGRPHSREALAAGIWSDSPSAQAKKQLRQVLWQLHSALDRGADASDRGLLIVQADWVSLDPAMSYWLDVAAVEEAVKQTSGVAGRHLDDESVRSLEAAAELGEDDLLQGIYADWCIFERERFRAANLVIRDKLMAHCEAHSLYERGLVHGESILRHDQARERTHRRLMRLHAQAGDRTAALRQFERCAAALEQELGVGPSRRTRALCAQIRDEQFPAALGDVTSEASARPAPPDPTPLADTLAQLKHLHGGIRQIEAQLRKKIAAIEGSLRLQSPTQTDREHTARRRNRLSLE